MSETTAERAHLADTLELAVAAANLGTWEWDPDTDQMSLSRRAAEIYGVPADGAYSREWLRHLIHPDHRDRAQDLAARAVAERTDYDIEYPLNRPGPGGGFVWVAAHGRGVFDSEGKLVRTLGVVQDITARKQSEARLRESEERQRTLADNLPSGFIYQITQEADGSRRFSYVSGGVVNLCGVTPEEVLANPATLHDMIVPEDRARVAATEEAAVRSWTLFDCQFRIHVGGVERWLHCRSAPRRRPDGSALWDGIAIEVTAGKQTESDRERLLREVKVEQQRLEEVFQHAPSFMAVLRGPDHVFERANDRYRELTGGRQLIGRTIREAFPEIDGQGFFEILDRVYRTGERHVETDARVMLRGGTGDAALEERFLEFVYQPIREADGAVSGILVQGIDLTDRRRKRHYETALSSTPDFVYVFDLEHRFTYVNEALLSTWGKTWDEAIGKTCLELGYEPWHAEMHDREVDQVAATKKPIRNEVPFTGTGGRRIYDYIFVPIFGQTGEVEAVAGTTRDITDRKAMEDALREADRKKDDFIALLAHELRNPLAPIRNGLEILRLSQLDPAALERARSIMDRQLGHMVRLIDDLLDVSRIGRHKMKLRRQRLLLSDAIGSAVEAARPLIDAAGQSFVLTLPSEPITLDADLTRLAQVFGNLLSNSVKYTKRGGTIQLSAERVGDHAVVRVRDNGIGIPAASLPTIFDMFSQVDRSIERNTGGLGIGLALVKGLVEMHGGDVTAESPGDNAGSTFTIRLPIAAGTDSPEPSRVGVIARSGRRILVVDDNRDGAESMAAMLRLRGDESCCAHDGLEAVRQAESQRPDVILMDVGMPKLNGLDATRRIRQQPWGKAITIIALTGWGTERDREQSRDAGCDGHLVKPVQLADLDALLEGLAEKRVGP